MAAISSTSQSENIFVILVENFHYGEEIVSIIPNPRDSSVISKYSSYREYFTKERKKCLDEYWCHYPTIVCDSVEERNRIMFLVENKFPVAMIRKHNPRLTIKIPTIISLHQYERDVWLNSQRSRQMCRLEISDAYIKPAFNVLEIAEYYGVPDVTSSDKNENEQNLCSFMKRQSRIVDIPDPNLIQTEMNAEAIAVMEIFHVNLNFVQLMLEIPMLFPAFAALKNEHKIDYSINSKNLLIKLEYAHVTGRIPFSETNMCVGRLDNPLFNFTGMSPKHQDKALSLVTHGISDMIDYSQGAYLSGSMIAATIQYIKNGNLRKLEANYPRVYTDLCPEYDKNELRGCTLAVEMGLATVSFSMKDDKLIATFEFDSSKEVIHPDEDDPWSEELMQLAKAVADFKYPKIFAFILTPGCDIDIPVKVIKGKANIKMVADDLLEKMAQKWPGAYLRVIRENRTTPMFRITIDDMKARFSGFRDVEIYPSADPPSQIATYHVNAVRAWKGQQPGIFATASAFYGHLYMITDHHHYFAGKSQPWEVLDKYATRGFSVDIDGYNELRAKIDNNVKFLDLCSNIGLVGKYCYMPTALETYDDVASDVPALFFDDVIHDELEAWKNDNVRKFIASLPSTSCFEQLVEDC